MERMRGQGGVYGGGVFLITGRQIEQRKKTTKIKYDKGLRWPPFDILHATTNQKQAGVMEEGWDRLRDRVRTLRERDGNDEPLSEGDNDDDDEYDEDGDIPDDSAPPAESIARSCPVSQRASVPSR
jgi:hypothetical protein